MSKGLLLLLITALLLLNVKNIFSQTFQKKCLEQFSEFPDGSFIIRNFMIDGNSVNIDIKQQDSFIISDDEITLLLSVYSPVYDYQSILIQPAKNYWIKVNQSGEKI